MQQIGVATVRGIDGTVLITGSLGSIVPTANNTLIKAGVTDDFEMAMTRDGNNDVFSVGFSGRTHKLDITIIVKSTTLAFAKSVLVLLDMGAIVTIASNNVGSASGTPTAAGQFNGDWNYTGGGTFEQSPTGESALWTIPSMRFAVGAGQPAKLTAVVG